VAGSDDRHCPRRAEAVYAKRNYPRLTYLGPPIAINTNAERASRIIERIRSRCPELTPGDLMLVARVMTESQRGKTKAEAPRPRPARAAKGRS
jgi:hypothetical protein